MLYITYHQRNPNLNNEIPLPIKIARLWNTDNTKCWWRCAASGALSHCWKESKMIQQLRKADLQFLTKLKILLCNIAIALLDIYSKEFKTNVHTKTCTQMFTAVLLITLKTWKQPRCLLGGKRINKLVHPDSVILFSVKEKWAFKSLKGMKET